MSVLQLPMANPPRKVKRLRDIALRDSPSPSLSAPSPSPPAAPPAPAPRRRGRKPAGPLSKTAREQLRKTNHSVIEKRRREKINEALAALRELVPSERQDGERREDKEFKLEVLVRTVEHLRVMVDRVKTLEAARCQSCGGSLSLAPQTSSRPAVEDAQPPRPVKRMRVDEPDGGPGCVDNARPDAPPAKPASPRPRLPSISSWMPDASLPSSSQAYQLPSPPQTVTFAPTTIAATAFPPRLVLPSPVGPPIGPSPFASPASPAPFPSSLVPSPAPFPSLPPLKSLTSPAPFACPTLSSPAFAPTPLTSQHSDRGHDKDVPDLPLDTNPDPEHPRGSGPHNGGGHYPGGGRSTRRGNGTRHGTHPLWSRDDQTAASLLLNISSRPARLGADDAGEDQGRGLGQGHRENQGSGSGSGRTLTLKGMMGARDTTGNGDNITNARPDKRTRTRRAGDMLEAQTPRSLLGMGDDSASGEEC